MPRKRLPPRLYLRPEKAGRAAVWTVRDGEHEESTGHGPECKREAEAALGAYLIAKSSEPPTSPQSPEALTVGQALTLYADEHGYTTAAPERLAYAIDRLAAFFAALPVSAVKGNTCRRYMAERRKPRRVRDRMVTASASTVRRELGVLNAALVHCAREGYLITTPLVWLPEAAGARERWLTRQEAARLLRAARRTPHLARFILIGLYTGSRSGAIKGLQWMPNTTGGHVDLERGLMFRRSAASRETKKRQTPVRIPRQLLGHLRRWHRMGGRFVVEYRGDPVKAIKTAWNAAVRRSGIEDAHPHDLRRTAVTWAMQRGVNTNDAAGFFGMTRDMIERVYGVHHPDYQESAVRAMEGR